MLQMRKISHLESWLTTAGEQRTAGDTPPEGYTEEDTVVGIK